MELPKKLTKDSIVETVCEIRFDSKDFPEVILGKLLSVKEWEKYKRVRTAIADIPAPIRSNDVRLKHQALMQLTSEDNLIAIKIGSSVIAYNNITSYKGWDTYFPEIKHCVEALFTNLEGVVINRIGLRYINALNSKDHFINSINDLNVGVQVASKNLSSEFNLNYSRSLSGAHNATVRISTPEFVKGVPKDFSAVVDIDIFSKNTDSLQSQSDIEIWISEAHLFEKQEFFSLIPNQIVEKLKEK